LELKPLEYLDFLMLAFTLCRATKVMEYGEALCLEFMYRAREVECGEIVQYLVNKFEAAKNKTRILALMCRYIQKMEDGILLDFNLSRHKSKVANPPGCWMTARVSYSIYWSYIFRIGSFAKCEKLKEKVARRARRSSDDFWLQYRNEILKKGYALRNYGVRDGAALTVYASQYPTVSSYREACPTAEFAAIGFSSVIFTELENSTDQEYLRICARTGGCNPACANREKRSAAVH
jgi:hypothetical protein